MTKALALALVALALGAPEAGAGPYCGNITSFAPANGTVLPVAPLIAQNFADSYYGGKRKAKAQARKISATIDGKRVSITTREVRTVEGIIRLIKIGSRKTGQLQIWGTSPYDPNLVEQAVYTIAKDAPISDKPTATVTRGVDARIAVYRYRGELAIVAVDVPAISFKLKWRRDRDDAWRVRPLEAWTEDGRSEARLGQSMCGMVENVPLALLEKGIEVELTAKLPDGRDVAVTEGLASPLVIPPRPAAANVAPTATPPDSPLRSPDP